MVVVASDAKASEQSIYSQNQGSKRFLRVVVNPYVPMFQGLDTRGGRKVITHTHMHMRQFL